MPGTGAGHRGYIDPDGMSLRWNERNHPTLPLFPDRGVFGVDGGRRRRQSRLRRGNRGRKRNRGRNPRVDRGRTWGNGTGRYRIDELRRCRVPHEDALPAPGAFDQRPFRPLQHPLIEAEPGFAGFTYDQHAHEAPVPSDPLHNIGIFPGKRKDFELSRFPGYSRDPRSGDYRGGGVYLSFNPTMRLKTGPPGFESASSAMK